MFKVWYNKSMHRSTYTRATTKNRRKIQSAFAELLAERGSISNITVTDLAERAEITRGTFYNYYNNIYEVGAEIQHEIEKQLFSEYSAMDTADSIECYIDEVFAFLDKQEGIYRELLASDASSSFLTQFENEMNSRVLAAMRRNGAKDKKIELELLFTIDGAIAIVRKYYRQEVTLSLNEIRDYLKARLRWLFEHYLTAST